MARGETEERIIRAMKEHGFTASDARAYLALLKSNPATGYELAASSGVPRSAIYNVLRKLEGAGLVNAIEEKPAKYIPLPPESLCELIESRFTRSLEELKTSLKRLDSRTTDVTTWTIQGYGAMLDRARNLISTARESVYASLWGREAERLASAFREACDAGVEVVLFSFTPLPDDVGRALSYGIDEHELGRYWPHKLILVVDHSRALVGSAQDSEDNRAVVTEETALVEMAVANLVLDVTLYGQRKGVDTSDLVTHLTALLAPVEDLIDEAATNGK